MKYEPLKRVKRAVLLDTDIGPDCDDVGALVLLHHLAKNTVSLFPPFATALPIYMAAVRSIS